MLVVVIIGRLHCFCHDSHGDVYFLLSFRNAVFNMTSVVALARVWCVQVLDTETYPCGKAYFENPRRMFAFENPCEACMVMHNNWIVGSPAKVFRCVACYSRIWYYLGGLNAYYTPFLITAPGAGLRSTCNGLWTTTGTTPAPQPGTWRWECQTAASRWTRSWAR